MDEKTKEWSQSLFDESILAAVPFIYNKKKLIKISYEEAIQYFKTISKNLIAINEIKSPVYFEELKQFI